MPADLLSEQVWEMAEQDQVFYKAWADFQIENPRFQDYRLEPDDGAGRDPAWLKLQAEHPRFLMHRPVPKMALESTEIECSAGKNLAADVAAGAALGVALSRARAGKKMSMSGFKNLYSWMAAAGEIIFAVTLFSVGLLVGFQLAQTSVFEQGEVRKFEQFLKDREVK